MTEDKYLLKVKVMSNEGTQYWPFSRRCRLKYGKKHERAALYVQSLALD